MEQKENAKVQYGTPFRVFRTYKELEMFCAFLASLKYQNRQPFEGLDDQLGSISGFSPYPGGVYEKIFLVGRIRIITKISLVDGLYAISYSSTSQDLPDLENIGREPGGEVVYDWLEVRSPLSIGRAGSMKIMGKVRKIVGSPLCCDYCFSNPRMGD